MFRKLENVSFDITLDNINREYNYGDLIQHRYLHSLVGTDELLDPAARLTNQERLELQLCYLQFISKLRRDLLKRHKKFIVAVLNEGYRIVTPKQQGETAFIKGIAKIRNTLLNTETALWNVNYKHVDHNIVKADTDRLTFIGGLKTTIKGRAIK